MVKNSDLKTVFKSYEDSEQYSKLFKKEGLRYDRTQVLKDSDKGGPIGFRKKIVNLLDEYYHNTLGFGKNPYTVNLITFSGHGYDFNGDAIAVIAERIDN